MVRVRQAESSHLVFHFSLLRVPVPESSLQSPGGVGGAVTGASPECVPWRSGVWIESVFDKLRPSQAT